MIKVFTLPDLGEGLTESEIVAWKVSVGDTVTLNQVIAEVETAKAVVELPSPYEGVISVLHEAPGTVVEVGKPIVSFELPGTDEAASGGTADTGVAETGAGKRVPTLVGYGAEPDKGGRPARRSRAVPQAAQTAVAAVAPVADVSVVPVVEVPEPVAVSERPRSTPPVRKLARDLGIDLTMVTGTGANGLITREDVQEASSMQTSARSAQSAQAAVMPLVTGTRLAADEREVRTPIKGVRKYTAAAMVSSAFTAPHVTEFLTIDVTPTMELLARLKAHRTFTGLKLTPLTIVAKALCIAIGRNPSLNSRWDEANQEIVTFSYVNLGIAAATPRGLTVPNIKDAETKSLVEMAQALGELTDTARAGKTMPEALSGGTISITNIGVFGIDAGTPILNPGEAGILAIGSVRKQPWEYRDEVALRQVMTLSLSFDHRLVDGEQGSKFLADIGTILADPSMLITMI